jgi:ribulose-5-phosphate 4-epimerase/fuculose-1-phosphate aldolase
MSAALKTGSISDAERAIRVDLAAAYRLVALFGWDDIIFTHISARIPGPEHHFLINPYGLMFEEMTASSLVKIDLEGKPVGEQMHVRVNPAGFTIHSAIHEVRDDAGCVIHLHTPDGTAVATSKEGLQPLNQTAQLVIGDLVYHDYEGVALDHSERPRLQEDLGQHNIMLLKNHGTLTVGRNCAEAFMRMYYLERACTMQVRTRLLGRDDHQTAPTVIQRNVALSKDESMGNITNTLAWAALLRKLDRIDPGFRN